MNERETEIYKGLNSIGSEIATFFRDAVQIFHSDYESKPYLLAHLAREIESGLRDVFSPKEKKPVCEKCKRPLNKKDEHKESILKALGIDKETDFAKKWYSIATLFPKYAHRHGVWKNPRELDGFNTLWLDFMEILEKLVGNYYAITERLDSIVKTDKPTSQIIGSLPNLLKLESRYVYFFNNIESAIWLESLYDNGYFSGDKNPSPIESEDNPGFYSIPYWHVLTYLEKVSSNNLSQPNSKTNQLLIKIVDEIISYENERGERIDNNRTDYSIIKIIACLPLESINKKHFSFFIQTLNSKWSSLLASSDFGDLIIKRFIKEKKHKLILDSFEVLFSYKSITATYEIISVFDYNYLSSNLNAYKKDMISICGISILKLALKKLTELIQINNHLFSFVNIPAVEDHQQTSFPERYENQLIYFIRDCFQIISDPLDLQIASLLRKKHPIYQRIALNAINNNYLKLNKHFWNWRWNPIEDASYKHELYELVKNHSHQFSQAQIDKVIEWIESKKYYIPDDAKDNIDLQHKIIAYRKKEWLSALESSNNRTVKVLFEKYHAINPSALEHPGFDIWHGGISGTISPLGSQEILEKKLIELIDYFISYSKENHPFIGPSIEGLADAITLTIRKNPNNFVKDCTPVIEAPAYFKYCWIRGLHESWHEEKLTFDPTEVLKSIKTILTEDEFWEYNNNSQEGSSYYNWFLSNVLSFIEDGTMNDSQAFDEKLLPDLKKLLFIIIENDKSPVFDMSNLSMTVVNDTQGKIYQSLLLFSLRYARLNSELEDRWDKDIKAFIEGKLNDNEIDTLLYFCLGQFVPNIHYISEEWLIKNFSKIFPKENFDNWVAAITGYFFFNPQPRELYFNFLHQEQHLQDAISNISHPEINSIKDNLIHQICVAYASDKLPITDNLIIDLLKQKTKEVYHSIIFFFWSPNFPLLPDYIKKIKPLWRNIYNITKNRTMPDVDNYILSGCLKWIKNIDTIDEDIYGWIIDSVKTLEQFDKSIVISSLEQHLESNTQYVSEILLAIFTKEVNYDMSRGTIKKIVEKLYKKGQKEYADKICLLHAEKGIHFLRETFEQYNPK